MEKQAMAKIPEKSELQKLTMKELVEIYNANSEKPVKKFSDQKTAVKRVDALRPEGEKPAKKAKGEPKSKLLDIATTPMDEAPFLLPNGNPRRILLLADRASGVKESEVLEIAGKDAKVRGIFRAICRATGVGVKEAPEGTFRLVGEVPAPRLFSLEKKAAQRELMPRAKKRTRIMEMISRKSGATVEDIQTEIGLKSPVRVFEGLRIMNSLHGIGCQQDERGAIRAV